MQFLMLYLSAASAVILHDEADTISVKWNDTWQTSGYLAQVHKRRQVNANS